MSSFNIAGNSKQLYFKIIKTDIIHIMSIIQKMFLKKHDQNSFMKSKHTM